MRKETGFEHLRVALARCFSFLLGPNMSWTPSLGMEPNHLPNLFLMVQKLSDVDIVPELHSEEYAKIDVELEALLRKVRKMERDAAISEAIEKHTNSRHPA